MDDNFADLFGYDMDEFWAFDLTANLDFEPEIVSENEDTVTVKNGNGAILRMHKKHDTTPEHVGYTVQDKSSWEEMIKPILKPDDRRINFEGYRRKKAKCAERDRFFMWSGVNVFESIHPICGHENFMVGMALEPEWITDMAETYADLMIAMMETLFSREGKPDGIWFYEDMGFKERPFMSPAMYRELIMPAHRRSFDFAHGLGLPVIMHSCGFVEPLLPDMVEAGIDCLQVIEIKAGMDLLRIQKNFGDRLSLMGGMDVRTLYTNDRDIINRELESKLPTVKQGFGYVLHRDHSIPATVDYDIYCFFVERGLELGKY